MTNKVLLLHFLLPWRKIRTLDTMRRCEHLIVWVRPIMTHIVNVVINTVITTLTLLLHEGIILNNAVAIKVISHCCQRDNEDQVPHTHTRCQHRWDDG